MTQLSIEELATRTMEWAREHDTGPTYRVARLILLDANMSYESDDILKKVIGECHRRARKIREREREQGEAEVWERGGPPVGASGEELRRDRRGQYKLPI